METEVDAGPEDGFREAYGVQLLFREPPELPRGRVMAALARHCPDVVPLDPSPDATLLSFLFPDHPVALDDATMPAQIIIAPTAGVLGSPALEAALEQSWRFPAAREVVATCTSSVVVTDLMSTALPRHERLELFQAALAGVVEVTEPAAILWLPTDQVVDPRSFLAAWAEGGPPRFFCGALNVRMFNIEGTGGDRVMDTLGLAALGLPDIQCHFRDLSPSAVANVLYDVAHYVWEQGAVIEPGDTVYGIAPEERWRCRLEVALIEPSRPVIDVDPGPPFAAGDRGGEG